VTGNPLSGSIVKNTLSNLSFRKHIRFGGFIILLMILSIAVFHFVIFFIYANTFANNNGFQVISRPLVWVFLLFSILYASGFIYIVVVWKKNVKNAVSSKYGIGEKENNRQSATFTSKIISKYNRLSSYYMDNFDINGNYYLPVLYLSEVAESSIQLMNLFRLYSCALPIGWNMVFAFVLLIESSHRTKFMFRKIWGKSDIRFNERNLQVVVDIAIDLFFLIIPLVILWYGYNMVISIGEILQIVLLPSAMLLPKLITVIDQTANNHVNEEISMRQAKMSYKSRRNRRTFFGSSVNEEVEEKQNRNFPRYMKLWVFFVSFSFSVNLLIMILLQLTNLSLLVKCAETFDNNDLWKKVAK
jgi:hypothetical protein